MACGTATPAPEPDSRAPSAPLEASWFTEASAALGLQFSHRLEAGTYFMPHLMAAGVGLLDADADGRLDVLFLHGSGRDSQGLFRQGPNGAFEDVTAGSGLDVTGYAQGVAIGDFGNDGREDIAVTEDAPHSSLRERGRRPLRGVEPRGTRSRQPAVGHVGLLRRLRPRRLAGPVRDELPGVRPDEAVWQPTGQPDFCGPTSFAGTVTKLYRNRGSDARRGQTPRFDDVTVPSGLAQAAGPGLGLACTDLTGDTGPTSWWPTTAKPTDSG